MGIKKHDGDIIKLFFLIAKKRGHLKLDTSHELTEGDFTVFRGSLHAKVEKFLIKGYGKNNVIYRERIDKEKNGLWKKYFQDKRNEYKTRVGKFELDNLIIGCVSFLKMYNSSLKQLDPDHKRAIAWYLGFLDYDDVGVDLGEGEGSILRKKYKELFEEPIENEPLGESRNEQQQKERIEKDDAIAFERGEGEKELRRDSPISKKLDKIDSGINELNKKVETISENKTNNIPKELTVNFPKLRADQIIGRTTDIEDLRRRLFDNKQVVLVNGMGGIGKTTVGAVYATENTDAYKHIVWISQLSGDFVNDFINTPGLLENFNIAREDKTIEQLYHETIMALKSIEDTPCLMVIDNADTGLAKFYNSLPNQPNWHILVTSREEIPYFDLKELGFLSEEDAIKLFKKNYKRTDIADEDVKIIVKEIDYHTLTIEILAKTANDRRKSLKFILKAIEDDIEADITIRHSTEKIERITSYLCSIFKISKLNKNEKWLLANLSCLPPEFQSYKVLKEIIQSEKAKGIDFAKHLSNLTSKGWLLYDKTNDSYKLHRILIDVISKSLNIEIETVQSLLSNITSELSIYQLKDNPIDKFKWIPYGKSVLTQFITNTVPSLAILQNNLALVLRNLGGKKNLLEAKKWLEKAIDSAENNFGETDSTTATRYSNLALVLQALGGKENLQEAKRLLEKAINSPENNFGEAHPTTAVRHSNLALVLKDLGGKNNLQEAKRLLEKAIDSDENSFGEAHPTTATRYSNLALVLQALGGKENLQEAKRLLEKAINSPENNFGEAHPTTAVRHSNLALVLRDLGGKNNLQEAKRLLEKAIDSDENNFGKAHATTATRYSNLALVLRDLRGKNNLQEAKRLLEKAINSLENNFGEAHPTTAVGYTNLALVLRGLGEKNNLQEAKRLLEKAINSPENNFWETHPTTAIRYSNLALVLKDLGGKKNLQEAKRLLEKTINSAKNNFEEAHPTTAVRYSNLALVLKDLGGKENLREATELLEKAKNITVRTLGVDHPITITIINNLDGFGKL